MLWALRSCHRSTRPRLCRGAPKPLPEEALDNVGWRHLPRGPAVVQQRGQPRLQVQLLCPRVRVQGAADQVLTVVAGEACERTQSLRSILRVPHQLPKPRRDRIAICRAAFPTRFRVTVIPHPSRRAPRSWSAFARIVHRPIHRLSVGRSTRPLPPGCVAQDGNVGAPRAALFPFYPCQRTPSYRGRMCVSLVLAQ